MRAHDAADALALAELDSSALATPILVVNDAFGGLTLPLAAVADSVDVWTDSVLAETAIGRNLEVNGIDVGRVGFGPGAGGDPFGLVIVKVPKTLAFLRQQLVAVREVVGPETRIIGAGMVRHIHTSTIEAFESIIGPTVTSLAKRKARLIHPVFDADRNPEAPTPTRYVTDGGIEVVSHPNVFSATRLDNGTRLLLEHLPTCDDGTDVLDLGCGNGVVGASLAASLVGGLVTFTDVSRSAIASAKATWAANHDGRPARFVATDTADGVPDSSIDVVLVNPPFHDQHVVGSETAERMFRAARRVLRPGGRIVVVGNRHLGYHTRLPKLFADVEVKGSNPKFVVWSGRKR